MSPTSGLTDRLKLRAAELGFAQIGIAPAVTPTGFHRLLQWIDNGHAAGMGWVQDRKEAYCHPNGVMPGTRSVIMAAMNYFDGSASSDGARVARYALGSADYHDVLKARLRQLAALIRENDSAARLRVVVDTAPLLERDFGRLAGLGWFGKNTMLISRYIGSWFFLGAILTDAELRYDKPEEHSFCGTCTRCLDACPTNAFPEPGVLDARRCISYLTIEHRQDPIALELRSGIGDWVFGCDICQEVCPWNRFAPAKTLPEFESQPLLNPLDCRKLLQLSDDQFQSRFAGTPMERTGRAAILRNAAIVLGNQQDPVSAPCLIAALNDTDSLVRGAVAWALTRIATPEAIAALREFMKTESDPQVLSEIRQVTAGADLIL